LYSWEDMVHTLYTVGPAHKTCVSNKIGRSYSFREIVDYIQQVFSSERKNADLNLDKKTKLCISYIYFMKNGD